MLPQHICMALAGKPIPKFFILKEPSNGICKLNRIVSPEHFLAIPKIETLYADAGRNGRCTDCQRLNHLRFPTGPQKQRHNRNTRALQVGFDRWDPAKY